MSILEISKTIISFFFFICFVDTSANAYRHKNSFLKRVQVNKQKYFHCNIGLTKKKKNFFFFVNYSIYKKITGKNQQNVYIFEKINYLKNVDFFFHLNV